MKFESDLDIIYRAVVYFYPETSEAEDKVIDYAFKIAKKYERVNCVSTAGGPAWDPYITFECASHEIATNAIRDLEFYIKKFK